MTYQNPLSRIVLFVLLLIISNGCATQYGCKGMPDEPQCLSTTQAYAETNSALSDVEAADDRQSEPQAVTDINAPQQQPVPKIDDPTPIRTPSQVMRIWIAPWEDAEGDLMVSNYVYTELEPRRWMIGKAAPTLSPSLLPLQVEQRVPEKPREPLDAESRTFPLRQNNGHAP